MLRIASGKSRYALLGATVLFCWAYLFGMHGFGGWVTYSMSGSKRGTREVIVNRFNEPFSYEDEVDLRIIVMVYDRPDSVLKCLTSIQALEMDGDRGSLEIWIDRKDNNTAAHAKTVKTAESFQWRSGRSNVHIQEGHAGIYGQWINSWRPREGSSELALFLEDDVDVSPYAYRWLKAAAKKYANHPDIGGISLYEGALVKLKNPADLLFLFSLLGTQAFAPFGTHWRKFQEWYHTVKNNPDFHPYVENATIVTNWYKQFEREHRELSMWEMWWIRYADDHKLYTLYSNFAAHSKAKKLKTVNAQFLAFHRAEMGLHFHNKKGEDNSGKLIQKWQDYFTTWPDKVNKYNFDGKKVGTLTV